MTEGHIVTTISVDVPTSIPSILSIPPTEQWNTLCPQRRNTCDRRHICAIDFSITTNYLESN